jgi:hypothetical protein
MERLKALLALDLSVQYLNELSERTAAKNPSHEIIERNKLFVNMLAKTKSYILDQEDFINFQKKENYNQFKMIQELKNEIKMIQKENNELKDLL